MADAEFDFSGRSALITGAASGIGAATARWLERHKVAELILVDRDETGLDACDHACEVRKFVGDVGNPALWDAIAGTLNRLDHAVINAGVAAGGAIVDLSFDEWRRVMAVNLDGAFLSLRTAIDAIRRGGAGGSVVLTASVGGIKAEPGTAAYGASKAAVLHLTKVAAKEAADARIRINAIAPGGVDTPIWDGLPFFKQLVAEQADRDAAMAAMAAMATPLGRYATADEIGGQIGFLLSDMAATITGSVLVSDGGYSP